MKVYRGIVKLKRTTAGTVVYGNQDIPGQYISKELLQAVVQGEEDYPAALLFTISMPEKGAKAVKQAESRTETHKARSRE